MSRQEVGRPSGEDAVNDQTEHRRGLADALLRVLGDPDAQPPDASDQSSCLYDDSVLRDQTLRNFLADYVELTTRDIKNSSNEFNILKTSFEPSRNTSL